MGKLQCTAGCRGCAKAKGRKYLSRVFGAGCELFVGNDYPFETNKQRKVIHKI
jgi:hypothetical protein